jgi:hypothetical protein
MWTALLLACALAFPQESCPACLHQGVRACKSHAEVPLEDEQPGPGKPLAYCAWAAACADCEGTLWVDCGRCAEGEKTAAVEERRRLVRAWMEPSALERELGRSLGRLETERFALVIDLDVLPDGKKKLTGHQLAHQLARDLEHVAAKVTEHYAMTPEDYRAKMRMWMFADLATHQQAQAEFLGTITTGDFKMLGRDPVFSVWKEPPLFDTVPKVRSLFVHNAAHMLVSNAFQPNWIGDIGGGWLDAGLGHWYEYELFGRTVNYCLEESTLLENYEGGQWRAAVRRRLQREKDPFLPGLLPERTGAMSAAEHALCWSIYDWLLAEHPGKVRLLVQDLKRKQPAREVIAAHLGMDVFATDAAWRAWVAEAYPTKGDEPRTRDDGKKKSGR